MPVSFLPDSMPAVYRVEAVCLPFVLASRRGSGKPRTLDVRRVQLAAVDPRFGELVSERFAPPKHELVVPVKTPAGGATSAD